MKKLSFVLLVSLFVSIVTYGQTYWYGCNPGCIRTDGDYNKVGIGKCPTYNLDVNGVIRTTNFRMTDGAVKDYVLTCNGSGGAASWKPIPGGGGGGSCLWHEGSGSSIYYNDGSVGIGISSPSAPLDIANLGSDDDVPILEIAESDAPPLYNFVFKGDFAGTGETGNLLRLETYWGYNAMTWRGDGNVGIGTTNPLSKLSVGGQGSSEYAIYGWSGLNGIWGGGQYRGVYGYSTGSTGYGVYGYAPGSTGVYGEGVMGVYSKGYAYDFYAASPSGRSYFAGSVGIGTTNIGDYKLAVNGHILAKEIRVETGWSDFVFADNYQLMPLDKLEKHIREERSLPGIPKEKEVVKEGVALGEMQAKLLEKIEELTLYVIELKKENEELKKTNRNLEKRISKLEK